MTKQRLKDIVEFLQGLRNDSEVMGIGDKHIHMDHDTFLELFPAHMIDTKTHSEYDRLSVVTEDGIEIMCLIDKNETVPAGQPVIVTLD